MGFPEKGLGHSLCPPVQQGALSAGNTSPGKALAALYCVAFSKPFHVFSFPMNPRNHFKVEAVILLLHGTNLVPREVVIHV